MSNDLKVIVPASADADGWRLFAAPRRLVTARCTEAVLPALEEIEAGVADGLHAAGFLAYEAAAGLDCAFKTKTLSNIPLLCFGLFERGDPIHLPDSDGASCLLGDWRPDLSAEDYTRTVDRIKRYLRSGDTYQVNYTFRLQADFEGDPWALFLKLHRKQQARYSAFVETDEFALCSASPELFFCLDGETLESRPMKGTARRGLWFEQDERRIEELRLSAKNRAENVMIVDMVRNDMGRVAAPGTVSPASLFDVERYPTVLQMTSRVTCKTDARFTDIMKALFPCASITGAPKVRTMEIIRELEHGPRGVYTGAIGYLSPGRRSLFNVAIRTVAVDKLEGRAEYGVGGGIVWDSDAEEEYEECRTKTAVLTHEPPAFDLLETMLWEPGAGFFLIEEHLERLRRSAAYFGFRADVPAIRAALVQRASDFSGGPQRVRLTVSRDGSVVTEAFAIGEQDGASPRHVASAAEPVDANDRFLYHKTTHRGVYERARNGATGMDDVLLWNSRGEITESTIANVVIEKDGRRVTPPISCGLLPGVFRGWLLARGEIEEGVITLDDLQRADKLYLINSVRKWVPAEWVPTCSRPRQAGGGRIESVGCNDVHGPLTQRPLQ